MGGSKTSQHCFGMRLSQILNSLGTPNGEVPKWISKELDFDQLILEFYTKGQPNGWVHLTSFNKDGSNRRDIDDGLRVKQKDQVRKRSSLLIGLSLKIYLQFLFTIGLFQSKRTWVDKQIKWCYNVFDKLEIPYQKWY